MITIDGITYAIPVIAIRREAPISDRNAARTDDGILHRSVIGTYYNYYIEFGSETHTEVYEALYNVLTSPVEFHSVTVPGTSGTYTFTAYFASVKDELKKIHNGVNYWYKLSASFIARDPARTP